MLQIATRRRLLGLGSAWLLGIAALAAGLFQGSAQAYPPPKGTCAATSISAALKVCVTKQGNLISFDAPPPDEMIRPEAGPLGPDYTEGYSLCVNVNAPVAHDVQASHPGTGWLPTLTIVQPSPGNFPITITRYTADGNWKFLQRWAVPVGSSIKLTEVLTNLSSTTTFQEVELSRAGSFAPLSSTSPPTTWLGMGTPFAAQIVSQPAASAFGPGIELKAASGGTHVQTVEDAASWAASTAAHCDGGVAGPVTTGPVPATFAGRVSYHFPTIPPGGSDTVVLYYAQM